MDIETIKIQCPSCGHNMEYWTKRNFINCVECGTKIDVEPCKEKLIEEELTEEETDILEDEEVAE